MASWTTPKTWAVGDVLTAADMNTYVRDNIGGYLYGDTAWTLVPSFSGTWVNFGGGFCRAGYRLLHGAVMLRGLINGPPNTPAFTLPVGYRPAVNKEVPIVGGSTVNSMCAMAINTTGVVTPATFAPSGFGTSYYSLSGVRFDLLA